MADPMSPGERGGSFNHSLTGLSHAHGNPRSRWLFRAFRDFGPLIFGHVAYVGGDMSLTSEKAVEIGSSHTPPSAPSGRPTAPSMSGCESRKIVLATPAVPLLGVLGLLTSRLPIACSGQNDNRASSPISISAHAFLAQASLAVLGTSYLSSGWPAFVLSKLTPLRVASV